MRLSSFPIVLAVMVSTGTAAAEDTRKTLSLEEALATAKRGQPRIVQARASTEAARARVDQAGAGLLPQVAADAQYQHTTGSGATRFGSGAVAPSSSSVVSTNFLSFGVSASMLVWDFNQTSGRKRAAEASAKALGRTEAATAEDVALGVRTAYFTAQAQRALVEVGREAVENQERHLQQIQGFVNVGTRPEIDLAQSRTDLANAKVQLINAENAYEVAKATLNQAMGVEGSTEYEVVRETFPAIEGEDLGADALLAEALKARPELAALAEQVRAQELTLGSIKGQYWPSLSASTGLSESGTEPSSLGWAWTIGADLRWPIYEGGITNARVAEANANITNLRGQMDSLRQQVRLDVDQARFGLRGAKAALDAAEEALKNARERLRLAEGRYQTGVGSVIELGDAQLALTSAEAQRVQADDNLAQSRARMLKALGRE